MPTATEGVAPTTTVLLPCATASVGRARRAMAHELRSAGVASAVVDDACLVLSEILSNALKHARPLVSGQLRVRWAAGRDGVEVEVTDGGSATRPRPTDASMSATGGRGLSIVNDLARDWGVHDEGGRTTVWAVVSTQGVPDATGRAVRHG